ncbi:MAG TPA: hypothetical protein VFH48_28590 [Chloroflexota bacterium]|nr:hypothetical protein [Chloroflexota bacterium]
MRVQARTACWCWRGRGGGDLIVQPAELDRFERRLLNRPAVGDGGELMRRRPRGCDLDA